MFEIFHDEKLGKQDKIKKEWLGDEEVETASGANPLNKFGHEWKWESRRTVARTGTWG